MPDPQQIFEYRQDQVSSTKETLTHTHINRLVDLVLNTLIGRKLNIFTPN